MHRRLPIAALCLLLLALLLSGCGRSRAGAAEPAPIRTPLPTFTPTPPPGALLNAPAAQGAVPASSGETAASAAAAPAEVATETPGIGGPVAVTESLSSESPSVESASSAAPETPTLAPTPLPLPADAPLAVINTELVNSRSGPDTSYPVVMVLGRGEEYDVTGKSADGLWFRLCCVQSEEAWVMGEFVDTDGATDPVPVAQAGERSAIALATLTATAAPAQPATGLPAEPQTEPQTEQPTATPQPIAEAPGEPTGSAPATDGAETPTETAAGTAVAASGAVAPALELVAQEQFPETNVVRVFLYVYAENDGLEGYSLRVTQNGVEHSAVGVSFGGRPGLTWPIADDRQRFQNLKVEFPGVDPAGDWNVTIIKDGAPAGPSALFTLAANDPNRELYVRYKRP